MTTTRHDTHRPAEITPAHYRHLFSFSYPGMDGVGFNLGLLRAVRTGQPQQEPRYGIGDSGSPLSGKIVITGYVDVTSPWGKLPFFHKANEAGGCDICGAAYRHGDAFLHEPTGEVILIGHICADKMDLHVSRGDWTAHQRRLTQLRKTAEYQLAREEQAAQVKAEAIEFLDEHEGLRGALEVGHRISQDLKSKLWAYGKLSDRQVELAFKLEAEAKSDKPSIPEILPPAGRIEIAGKVLSVKLRDTDYGEQLKMTVEVAARAGKFRLWGTVPRCIDGVERGDEVRFTATVSPKEPGFGFFSRPANAYIAS